MLGPELRAIRERRLLSLTEVCEASGISTSALSAFELGERYPALDTVERLCAALNLTLVVGPKDTHWEEND